MIETIAVEFKLTDGSFVKVPCSFTHEEGLGRYFEMDKYLKENPDLKTEKPTLVNVNNKWFGVIAFPIR
jgi:hypothetical protein